MFPPSLGSSGRVPAESRPSQDGRAHDESRSSQDGRETGESRPSQDGRAQDESRPSQDGRVPQASSKMSHRPLLRCPKNRHFQNLENRSFVRVIKKFMERLMEF